MAERSSLLARVFRLYNAFQNGEIPTLAQHEVNPGFDKSSRENYLYFTLPPCLNFQRSSPAMWASALRTYEDEQTRYLFYPEKVVERPKEQIQHDLVKHKLALQPNRHTAIWMAICQAFHTLYQDDPRHLFSATDWDIPQILKTIQIDQRAHFPYLSGPKMANYWLYILSHYTNAKFKNLQALSIIPDTHVIQSTKVLGVLDEIAPPLVVAQAWKDLLQGSDLAPFQMHAVLWNWSRNNFQPSV